MFPQSTLGGKKNTKAGSKTEAPKIGEEKSKDIMNKLFEDLDQQDEDELEDVNNKASIARTANQPVAFNKHEQLQNKYNVSLTNPSNNGSGQMGPPASRASAASNPFKKRSLNEISKPSPQ